jgi:hypothetical protein
MAVEDVLDHGSVADWRDLAARVRQHPYGEAARSLRQVLAGTYMYGTTRIWIEFLRSLTGENLKINEAARKRWEECAKYGY